MITFKQIFLLLSVSLAICFGSFYPGLIDPEFSNKETLHYQYFETSKEQNATGSLTVYISTNANNYEVSSNLYLDPNEIWADYTVVDRHNLEPSFNSFYWEYNSASNGKATYSAKRTWDYSTNKVHKSFHQTGKDKSENTNTDSNLSPYYMTDTMFFAIASFLDISKPVNITVRNPWIIVRVKSDIIENIEVGTQQIACQKVILSPEIDFFFFSIPVNYKTSYLWLSCEKPSRLIKAEINISDKKEKFLLEKRVL